MTRKKITSLVILGAESGVNSVSPERETSPGSGA